MDFEPMPGTEELSRQYNDFFREEMKNAPPGWANSPDDLASDEGWAFALSMARKLGEKGWLALSWPKKYGGLEKSIFEQLAFNEARAYWDVPSGDGFGTGMLGPTLLSAGNEEQRERFLPPIARGEAMWCQLWSEPNAGSDLAAVETFAQLESDHYIVNGQKTWTSSAQHADWGFALVKTSRELTRSRGLSFLLIDMKAPGVTIRPLETMSSYQQTRAYFNEVFFDNVKVPVTDRVGEENDGWRVTRSTMNFERSGLANLGAYRRELNELIEFCRKTTWRGRPMIEDPITRSRLTRMMIELEAGVAAAKHILWSQHKLFLGQETDSRERTVRSSAMKYYRTQWRQQLAVMGSKILGLYSQLKRDSEWAPLNGHFEHEYQEFPGHNIAAGSTEIQKNLVAWEGLGLPRS